MKDSTRFFAPVLVALVVAVATQWSIAGRVDTPAPVAQEPVSITPFDYFPAHYTLNAAEGGEQAPTF